jgi:RNA polymerase sigma factor FliA
MRIYFPPQAEVEDLYSVGITGLIAAIRRCDPEKTESFGSYAALRIRGAILDELRRLDWMPRSSRLQSKKYRKAVEELEQELGRPATEAEIQTALNMSAREHALLLDQIRPVTLISLDQDSQTTGGEARPPIHEAVSDDTELNARERAEKKEMVRLMKDRLKELPDIPRKVLTLYYFEGLRLAEIAEVFSLTESRICQIHAQAILSLRSYLDKATQK